MTCDYCDIIERKKETQIIYEDELCICFLSNNPIVPGHIILIPKEHYAIIEQTPDEVVANLFSVANKLSTIAFETLGAKGTNILVQNGISAGQESAHFSINILPRSENDGINLQWELKEASKNDLDDAELMLKEETKNIVGGKVREPEKPREISSSGETIAVKEDETDYRLDQLNRIP